MAKISKVTLVLTCQLERGHTVLTLACLLSI